MTVAPGVPGSDSARTISSPACSPTSTPAKTTERCCMPGAASSMSSRGRPNPVLLLAGRPAGTENAVKALAFDLDLGDHLRFLGDVEDVRGLLAAVDLAIFSSRSELSAAVRPRRCGRGSLSWHGCAGIVEAIGKQDPSFLSPPGDDRVWPTRSLYSRVTRRSGACRSANAELMKVASLPRSRGGCTQSSSPQCWTGRARTTDPRRRRQFGGEPLSGRRVVFVVAGEVLGGAERNAIDLAARFPSLEGAHVTIWRSTTVLVVHVRLQADGIPWSRSTPRGRRSFAQLASLCASRAPFGASVLMCCSHGRIWRTSPAG